MAILDGTDGPDRLLGTARADRIHGFDPDGVQATARGIDLVPVADGFEQPLLVVGVPDEPGLLLVGEKGGQVELLDARTGAVRAEPVLDLDVATGGEQGLLGLALHPEFARNGRLFAALSVPGEGGRDVELRSFTLGPDFTLEPGSETGVLRIDYPRAYQNHRAGWIGFGPDGLLYLATGDGGGAFDPRDNAEDPTSPLGKILRIDVDRDAFPADPARNYAIPADNPFAGALPGLDEIWALGLRNPFRNGFDPATGRLYLADVGQAQREELNLGRLGADYGWDRFEGSLPLEGGAGAGLTRPIHEYGHDLGASVIAGEVVRGGQGALQGALLFGDFISGRLWALREDGQAGTAQGWAVQDLHPGGEGNWSGFGADARGDVFAADFAGSVVRIDVAARSGDQGDRIAGGGGGDWIWAGGGSDRVRGDAGADRIHGQAGDDILSGGAGPDRLWGDAGNDRLSGDLGGDWLDGGAGVDWAVYAGSGGSVRVDLAAGRGAGGHADGDRLFAIEAVAGSRGGDLLWGDQGANRLDGLAGDDRLEGRGGGDWLRGGTGDDVLAGGAGADVLEGGPGRDRIAGGEGADRFVVRGIGDGRDVVLDFDPAEGDRLDLRALGPLDFVGDGAFAGGGTASVRVEPAPSGLWVLVDQGDGIAAFGVKLRGLAELDAEALLLL